MTLAKENTTCYILAGGESSRMGSDKGKLMYKGKGFVEQLVNIAETVADRIVIIANKKGYEHLGEVIKDEIPMIGPLGGIITGLRNSSTSKNLFISCDTPKVESNLLSLLVEHSEGYQVCCPSYFEMVHPLIGVYEKSSLPELEACAQKGNLAVSNVVRELNSNLIDLGLPEFEKYVEQLANINTVQEYQDLEKE